MAKGMVTQPTMANDVGLADDCDLDLINWASFGDEAALERVTALADQQPEFWRALGDVAELSQQTLISQTSGKDHLARRAMQRNLERLRADLTQPGDGALEQLLVERVLTTWLQVGYADIISGETDAQHSIEQGDYHQRRIDAAHRRFLSAARTLATVRKLARPNVQINLAQQVNVAC